MSAVTVSIEWDEMQAKLKDLMRDTDRVLQSFSPSDLETIGNKVVWDNLNCLDTAIVINIQGRICNMVSIEGVTPDNLEFSAIVCDALESMGWSNVDVHLYA